MMKLTKVSLSFVIISLYNLAPCNMDESIHDVNHLNTIRKTKTVSLKRTFILYPSVCFGFLKGK